MVNEKINNVAGNFSLPDGREVFGTLDVRGEASKVLFFDDKQFSPGDEAYNYITGELYDGRRVSLIQNTLIGTGCRFTGTGAEKCWAEVFPHYVTVGSAHVSASEACVEVITFAMEDASVVIYDFDAFSTVLDTASFIPLLRRDKMKYREVQFGEHPIIGYFTGKFEIVSVDTLLGEVRAEHRPSFTSGGPSGFRIDNRLVLILKPLNPVFFEEAMQRLLVLLRFFELLAGREQPLTELSLSLAGQSDQSMPIEVYRSFAPQPRSEDDPLSANRPHPADVLVSTRDDSKEYSTVLKNYLESDIERHDARVRIHYNLKNHRRYTIDRLIAAVNVFDVFPDTAYPISAPLSPELTAATNEARLLFRVLPDSLERSSVLGALGRVGKLSLKHKIQHRVQSTGLYKHFPKFIDVLKEAVNCRNHYVHGTKGRIDYSENFEIVCFFTDALEFAFAAADLIDAGWNIEAWISSRPGRSHLFGVFIAEYAHRLRDFEKMMGAETKSSNR
ncbi:MAG: hypothetical protein RBR35_07955 [Salinivirgaceae bacterium]|nr:hypothetical protein [Salinivirgaceae bacterium]